MIRLAPRFAPAALAALAATALVLWLRIAMGATSDPCADPARLAHLDAFGERHESRGNTEKYFEMHTHWVDGELAPLAPGGGRPVFRFVRSEDSFPFHGWITHYFPNYTLDEDRKELRATRIGSEVLPVHRVYGDSTGDIRLTKYLFVRGLEPVAHCPGRWRSPGISSSTGRSR